MDFLSEVRGKGLLNRKLGAGCMQERSGKACNARCGIKQVWPGIAWLQKMHGDHFWEVYKEMTNSGNDQFRK